MRVWLSLSILGMAAVFLTACSPLDAKKKAGLQVMTNDTPASLFLDGTYLDKTPFVGKDLKPGTYTLLVQPDDPSLAPHETTITLGKGLLTVVIWKPGKQPELSGGVIYEMEKLQSQAVSELSLITIPDGAIAAVDSQSKDFAPLLVNNITPGSHTFEVSLPSYETQSHNVNIVAGYRVNVTVKLAKTDPTAPNADASTTSGASQTSGAAVDSPSKTASGGAGLAITPATASAQQTTTSATPSARAATLTGPRVKILKTGYIVNNQEVLRVRDQASAGGKEIGWAVVGQEYAYAGATQSGWYKINLAGQMGWVTGEFSQLITP